jgi:hypothetical protein
MFDYLKKKFKKEEPIVEEPIVEPIPEVVKKPRKPRKPKEQKVALSEKEQATAADEPYISVLKMDIDPDNINSGSFELDWNSKFAANLARAGYQQKPGESEDVIVDRWFQTVCRNIALEVYEQNIADPINRETDQLKEELRNIRRTDIGNGRSEIS